MEKYRIEAGEETEGEKVLNVTLDGDLFAVVTFHKDQRTSQIRINPNVNRDDFIIDNGFVEMHKTLKNLLFQMHEEDGG
jgi:hypothetical protein